MRHRRYEPPLLLPTADFFLLSRLNTIGLGVQRRAKEEAVRSLTQVETELETTTLLNLKIIPTQVCTDVFKYFDPYSLFFKEMLAIASS